MERALRLEYDHAADRHDHLPRRRSRLLAIVPSRDRRGRLLRRTRQQRPLLASAVSSPPRPGSCR